MADGLLLWQRLCDDFTADSKGSVEWTNKINYWSTQIQRLCQAKKTAIFTLHQLTIDLERNEVTPRCLPIVVQEQMSQGFYRRLTFLVAELDPDSSSWSFWDFIRNPITFGINWITRKMSRSAENDGDAYVIVGQVQVFADAVHKIMKDNVGVVEPTKNLIDYDWLMELSKDIAVDESSFRLAILHLQRQRTCSVTTGHGDGGKIIRLLQPFDDCIPPSSVAVRCLSLKAKSERLELEIDRMQDMIRSDYQLVQTCHNMKNETKALKHLRRATELEQKLLVKERTLSRLLFQIREMELDESDKQKLESCQEALDLLDFVESSLCPLQAHADDAEIMLGIEQVTSTQLANAESNEVTNGAEQGRDKGEAGATEDIGVSSSVESSVVTPLPSTISVNETTGDSSFGVVASTDAEPSDDQSHLLGMTLEMSLGMTLGMTRRN